MTLREYLRFEVRPIGPDGVNKPHDRNTTIWRDGHVGRWGWSLTKRHDGSAYGYIGSDTTIWSFRLTRNP